MGEFSQIVVAWLLHQGPMIVILKSSSISHVDKNRAALDLRLSVNDLTELGATFNPPF